MREFTKSMLSLTWAVPLFGMEQMLSLSVQGDPSRPLAKATEGMSSVTETMKRQMGSAVRGMFDAGDRLQQGLVDMMFGCLGPQAFDPAAWMKTAADVAQSSLKGVGQMVPGAVAGAGQRRG